MSNFLDANTKQSSRSGLPIPMRQSCLAVLVIFAFALGGAFAQEAVEGIDNGNYHYQGSFELGYRLVNTNGSPAIYDTFVNQQQGPRLLEQKIGRAHV